MSNCSLLKFSVFHRHQFHHLRQMTSVCAFQCDLCLLKGGLYNCTPKYSGVPWRIFLQVVRTSVDCRWCTTSLGMLEKQGSHLLQCNTFVKCCRNHWLAAFLAQLAGPKHQPRSTPPAKLVLKVRSDALTLGLTPKNTLVLVVATGNFLPTALEVSVGSEGTFDYCTEYNCTR